MRVSTRSFVILNVDIDMSVSGLLDDGNPVTAVSSAVSAACFARNKVVGARSSESMPASLTGLTSLRIRKRSYRASSSSLSGSSLL